MHVCNDHKTVNWAFCVISWGRWAMTLHDLLLPTEFQEGRRIFISEPRVVASLQDGPQWSLPPAIPTLVLSSHSIPQGWSMWPREHSWSDGMSLPRLSYKRLWLPSWAFSLWGKPCCEQPYGPHDKELKPPANNHVSELGSGSSSKSSETAAPADSWETLRQKHPTRPLPDSWPSKIMWDICCFKF